jgi:hypothetical protein
MNAPAPRSERHLYVSWRDPESGSIRPVGCLIRRVQPDGEDFRFVYLKAAETLDGFRPLPGLPDLHEIYQSRQLFPVFANRLMPRSRPDYDALATRVDLSSEADPFELLERTGGRRVADRLEMFAPPEQTADGQSSALFFVRGVRYQDGASEAIDRLERGDLLDLEEDLENPVNPRAMLVLEHQGQRLGWIPDYLLDHLHALRDLNGSDPRVEVVHVNDEASGPHLRLLCRLIAPMPEGYEPFSEPEFQPIVAIT